MLVDLHLVDDVGGHLQAVLQLVERREERLLDNLQVAEVTARQIVHDEGDGLRQSLYLVALSASELEHVRVLLMRHDARTCGAVVWKLHKSEVLTVEHASVEGEFRYRAGYRSH